MTKREGNSWSNIKLHAEKSVVIRETDNEPKILKLIKNIPIFLTFPKQNMLIHAF